MKYAEARVRAEVFKALSHPVRLMMLDAMRKTEPSGSDLKKLAGISQSNISRHVAQLKRAGLVAERRHGTRVAYRLKPTRVDQTFEFAAQALHAEMTSRIALVAGPDSAKS